MLIQNTGTAATCQLVPSSSALSASQRFETPHVPPLGYAATSASFLPLGMLMTSMCHATCPGMVKATGRGSDQRTLSKCCVADGVPVTVTIRVAADEHPSAPV